MLRIGVLEMPVRSLNAHTAGISWCNTTQIRQSRFVRPRNPLTFAVSKGRLSAHHWVRFPSQKRITGHIALKWQSTRVDNGVDAMGGCGFESRCVRFAVACAVTRTHHPCEAVCKRKNLGVSQLRPSFIGSSVLSDAVQRRTMLYKTRYEYRYIYRGPNVFNTELPGCAR